jgi:hypothetical protein
LVVRPPEYIYQGRALSRHTSTSTDFLAGEIITPSSNSKRGNRRLRQNNRPNQSTGSLLARSVRRELSDSQSYQGQQHARLQITAEPSLLSTTVTTGVIAFSYQVAPGNVENWATRFGGTFDEYRILSAQIRVRPVSATSGVSTMWFDEKVVSAPTLTEAQSRNVHLFSNTNAATRSFVTMRWNARDLLDLQYTPTGTTTVAPVTFKIYSDATNYGAPIAATATWLIEPVFTVEFRGINP